MQFEWDAGKGGGEPPEAWRLFRESADGFR